MSDMFMRMQKDYSYFNNINGNLYKTLFLYLTKYLLV